MVKTRMKQAKTKTCRLIRVKHTELTYSSLSTLEYFHFSQHSESWTFEIYIWMEHLCDEVHWQKAILYLPPWFAEISLPFYYDLETAEASRLRPKSFHWLYRRNNRNGMWKTTSWYVRKYKAKNVQKKTRRNDTWQPVVMHLHWSNVFVR